jgi:hypothetical protein
VVWGAAWFALLLTFVVVNVGSAVLSFVRRRVAVGLRLLAELVPGAFAIFLVFYYVGDYMHLLAGYREYQAEVAGSPTVQHRFSWGGYGLVGSAQSDRVLVYAIQKPGFDRGAYEKAIGGSPPNVDYKRLTKSFWVEETNW